MKKLPLFLFVLGSLWYGGLFCYFNQDMIRVEIPYIGNFSIASAIVFLGSFVSGALFAAIFFAYDSLRKFVSLRRSQKQLAKLKKETESKAYPSIDMSGDKLVKHEEDSIDSSALKTS